MTPIKKIIVVSCKNFHHTLGDTKSNNKILIKKIQNHTFNHIQYQNINK